MRRSPRRVDEETLRRGLRILAMAVRDEPRIFAIAVGGSAVYGTMTRSVTRPSTQAEATVIVP